MWFRVDDRFASDPRVAEAGNAAMGLWVRAGAWSAGQGTDGHIPSVLLAYLRTSREEAAALVSAGLWLPAEDGYEFRDWADYPGDPQPRRGGLHLVSSHPEGIA